MLKPALSGRPTRHRNPRLSSVVVSFCLFVLLCETDVATLALVTIRWQLLNRTCVSSTGRQFNVASGGAAGDQRDPSATADCSAHLRRQQSLTRPLTPLQHAAHYLVHLLRLQNA